MGHRFAPPQGLGIRGETFHMSGEEEKLIHTRPSVYPQGGVDKSETEKQEILHERVQKCRGKLR